MKTFTFSVLLLFFASRVMGQTFEIGPLIHQPITSCKGQGDTLYVVGGGTDLVWNPSAGLNTTTGDTVIASPTVTTTYTVTGLGSGNKKDTGTVVIQSLGNSPNQPTFYQHGDTLTSSARYDNQWYRNDTLLLNDTSQYLIINTTGNYWLTVTNKANGCSTASDTVDVTQVTGINQLSAISSQLSVYPNPFANTVSIKINSSAVDVSDWNLQVTDMLGRILYSVPSLTYTNEIDLSDLSTGMYFITVITKTDRALLRVVKQ